MQEFDSEEHSASTSASRSQEFLIDSVVCQDVDLDSLPAPGKKKFQEYLDLENHPAPSPAPSREQPSQENLDVETLESCHTVTPGAFQASACCVGSCRVCKCLWGYITGVLTKKEMLLFFGMLLVCVWAGWCCCCPDSASKKRKECSTEKSWRQSTE